MVNPNKLLLRWDRDDNFKIDSAIKESLKTIEGRKFLWWLLEIGKVGMQPYTGEAQGTAFACGELNIGNQILARLISVSPDGYVLMMKEHSDERRTRDAALAGTSDADESDRVSSEHPAGSGTDSGTE